MWNKYPKNKDGMKQAIEDNGGKNTLDNALNVLKNNPVAKFALNGLGLNIEKMVDELNQTSNTKNLRPTSKTIDSLKDRLKKL